MLNNRTPWTDGLYGPEEWLTEHDLKHWCFDGDGDDTGSDDADSVEDEYGNMTSVFGENNAGNTSNTAANEDIGADAPGSHGMEQSFDQDNMSLDEVAAAMQNAAMGLSNAFEGTPGTFSTEDNDALGNTAADVIGSMEQANEEATNISSQLANMFGITSHVGINSETGLAEETTGFNAGPALGMAASMLGGPLGSAIALGSAINNGMGIVSNGPTSIDNALQAYTPANSGPSLSGGLFGGNGLFGGVFR